MWSMHRCGRLMRHMGRRVMRLLVQMRLQRWPWLRWRLPEPLGVLRCHVLLHLRRWLPQAHRRAWHLMLRGRRLVHRGRMHGLRGIHRPRRLLRHVSGRVIRLCLQRRLRLCWRLPESGPLRLHGVLLHLRWRLPQPGRRRC